MRQHVELNGKLLVRIKRLAVDERRPVSNMVRVLLEEALARREEGNASSERDSRR